jgi:aryl-alcohol dehydrogenase-like predicted oxidoreductase
MGCNLIDCAPNYRDGQAEKSVGEALREAFSTIACSRDEIFVTTKVGLLPESSGLTRRFACGPEGECFEPECVLLSLAESLERLGLPCVDCVFIHNLELLLLQGADHFPGRFRALANALERAVAEGMTRSWGISSWSSFRVPESHPSYLKLADLISPDTPHLRYLQIPLGLWGSEAITGNWQDGKSILAAKGALAVFANSSLRQGELGQILHERNNLVEHAVCFVRDTKGVDAVLLGIKTQPHIQAWQKMQLQSPRELLPLFEQTVLDV